MHFLEYEAEIGEEVWAYMGCEQCEFSSDSYPISEFWGGDQPTDTLHEHETKLVTFGLFYPICFVDGWKIDDAFLSLDDAMESVREHQVQAHSD